MAVEERVRTVEACIDLITGLLNKQDERAYQNEAQVEASFTLATGLLAKQDERITQNEEGIALLNGLLAKQDERIAQNGALLAQHDERMAWTRENGRKTRRLIILVAQKMNWLDDDDYLSEYD